jgi:predicted nucleic acid-binding protein
MYVLECITSLYDLDLDIVAPVLDITAATIQLAFERKTTFYDALYVALAQELGFQYVTADKKLYEKTKDLSFVILLKNINI